MLALCCMLGVATGIAMGLQSPQPLTSGMRLTHAVRIAPGEYRLEDRGGGVLQISGRNFVLDLSGVRIVGPGQRRGVGIYIVDARNITIKNADVTGMRWGVVLERCVGVTLEGCTASRNGNLPAGTVIDQSGREPEDEHGGGILIRDSRACVVRRCRALYQWDGIDVVRSDDNVIEDGDFSFNNNWGVHFWSASRNVFRRNRAIWCTTGQGALWQALSGWQTNDAQAVALDHNSNENLIEANDLRFSGDGIFIRANEGPLDPSTGVATPVRNGSHRNVLRNNDCSFSPNNAIEVDFVDDTRIEGNNCSFSNYGLWLGYSRRTIVRNNIALYCTTRAVEIENGQDGVFENNLFGAPRNPDAALIYLRQNGRDRTPSGPYRLTGNVFLGARVGLLLRKTPAQLVNNLFVTASGECVTVQADDASPVEEKSSMTRVRTTAQKEASESAVVLHPGTWNTLRHRAIQPRSTPIVLEVDGVPVWVRRVGRGSLTFWMPEDFWLRPAPDRVTLRAYDGVQTDLVLQAQVLWPAGVPRITGIRPPVATPGELVTVEGVHLITPRANPPTRVLLDGQPVTLLSAAPERVVFRAPEHLILTTYYNVLVEPPGAPAAGPIEYAVQVPQEKRPRLLSARFEPLRLRVGELLRITLEVRNDLPYPVPLMQTPALPELRPGVRGYEEAQAYWNLGVQEQKGALHLRITSEVPGKHHPGSWPWLFGFDRPWLGAGEQITVTAWVRVETPGEIEFRTGLVVGGTRFIDDNAFPTRIVVTEE